MTRLLAGLLVAMGATLTFSACGLVFDTDALERGGPVVLDGAVESEAGAAGDSAPECPSSRGPRMIAADGQCIDATEVTVADYEPFIEQERTLLPLPDPCTWVTELKPSTFDVQRKAPSLPVVDVHYCHALHYCKWADKRLCGRVGGRALAVGDAGMTADDNQWLRACTRAGQQRYSYGKDVIEGACTNKDLVPVGTRDVCSGPYPGLHDMLGNAGEWIDACGNDGPTSEHDGCTALGFEGERGRASCWHATEVSRYWTSSDLGFRCCSP